MSGGHNAITYRNFRKFNRINFRNDIASHCWDHIYNSIDPNEMWLQWKCSFLSIANKHAPLRTTRSSPWITSELKKRMHNRGILKIKDQLKPINNGSIKTTELKVSSSANVFITE